ncbi:MAG: hypothetical protein AB3N64_07265 [Puniceicoccaceae bacterium]
MQKAKVTICGLAWGILLGATPVNANYLQGLGTLANAPVRFTEATAISADGSVVVGKTVQADGSEFGSEIAYWWKNGVGMHSLGEIPQDLKTFNATAVSGDGTIVAGISVTGDVFLARVDVNGMVTDGNSVTGMRFAGAISADGKTIVGASGSFPTTAETRIIRNLDAANPLTAVPIVVEELNDQNELVNVNVQGVATATNSDGSVIVGYRGSEAFRIENNTEVTIEKDSTDQGLGPVGVSDDGLIVAGTRSTSEFLSMPFVWKKGELNIRELSTGAYTQVVARGLSGDGKTILGEGRDAFSRKRALLWLDDDGDGNYAGPGEVLFTGTNTSGNFQIQTVAGLSADGKFAAGWGTESGARVAFRIVFDATIWARYLAHSDGVNVDTGDFLGWINISSPPWVYVYSLDNYVYLPEEFVQDSGAWVWIGP